MATAFYLFTRRYRDTGTDAYGTPWATNEKSTAFLFPKSLFLLLTAAALMGLD